MSKPLTPKQRQYLPQVLSLYWKEGQSTEKIANILGLGHTTVWRWISIFAGGNTQSTPDMAKHKDTRPPQSDSTQDGTEAQDKDTEALEKEIARLKAELEKAELKAALYDRMIDIAEEQFDIPIRKKYGAKR